MKHVPTRRAWPALLLSAACLPGAWAASGQWDTALAVTGSAGTGNGASSATPWIATPAAGARYAEWNFFNGYPTDSTPDIAGTASVTENTGMAFLTGGGNVYSPGAATEFTVTAAALSGLADVWLRVGTLGSLPAASATLNGVAAQAVETFSANVGGAFGGTEKEWFWKWSAVAAAPLVFDFKAGSSSMSLDQLALYAAPTAAVPEPQAAALLALGLAGLAYTARRRRQQR
jgi:hypothetical protein